MDANRRTVKSSTSDDDAVLAGIADKRGSNFAVLPMRFEEPADSKERSGMFFGIENKRNGSLQLVSGVVQNRRDMAKNRHASLAVRAPTSKEPAITYNPGTRI